MAFGTLLVLLAMLQFSITGRSNHLSKRDIKPQSSAMNDTDSSPVSCNNKTCAPKTNKVCSFEVPPQWKIKNFTVVFHEMYRGKASNWFVEVSWSPITGSPQNWSGYCIFYTTDYIEDSVPVRNVFLLKNQTSVNLTFSKEKKTPFYVTGYTVPLSPDTSLPVEKLQLLTFTPTVYVPTSSVKGTSRPFNVGLAVGLCFGILSLVTCAVIGTLWYKKSRRKQHVIEPPSGMTARNSMGEEIDAMSTANHEDNSNGIIDSVQEEGRVQLFGDTTETSSVSRPSAGQVCVDKSKLRFHTRVSPSPTPADMPAKRTVEPSKPKARKMRSFNIGKDSTCIRQENALHGESILLKENEESWEIDRNRQRESGNLPGDGEFGGVNKGSYRGQDGRGYDVTAKRFEGEFCVHLSKERFRTSELPRPTPRDIPAKGTSKFHQPMPRTCDSGKDTRTSVGQNNALEGESILLKENEESWEIDMDRQRKSDNLPGDGEFGVVNKGSYRGQDGNINDLTAKRFKGEPCVHLSKEWFRTSELPRPTPSDIPSKGTLKFHQPMSRTCDSGKNTRTSVGQNNALERERYK